MLAREPSLHAPMSSSSILSVLRDSRAELGKSTRRLVASQRHTKAEKEKDRRKKDRRPGRTPRRLPGMSQKALKTMHRSHTESSIQRVRQLPQQDDLPPAVEIPRGGMTDRQGLTAAQRHGVPALRDMPVSPIKTARSSGRLTTMSTPRSARPEPLPKAMQKRMAKAFMNRYNSTSPLVTHNGYRASRLTPRGRVVRHEEYKQRIKDLQAKGKIALLPASSAKGGGKSYRSLASLGPGGLAQYDGPGDAATLGRRTFRAFASTDALSVASAIDTARTSASRRMPSQLPPVPPSVVSSSDYQMPDKWRPSHVMKDPGFIKKAKARGAATAQSTKALPSSFGPGAIGGGVRSGGFMRSPVKRLDGFITKSNRRKTRIVGDSNGFFTPFSSFPSAKQNKLPTYGFGSSRRWDR